VVDAPVPATSSSTGWSASVDAGRLRPAAAALAAQVAGHDVVAVDLPSGVDADTGEVRARSSGRPHPGLRHLQAGPARRGRSGRRRARGARRHRPGPELPPAPVEQLQDADAAGPAPARTRRLRQVHARVLGVVAGSQTYPGAAVLCVGAAATAGAGMVRFAGAPHPAEQVRLRWPEVVVTDLEGAHVVTAGRVQAWVVGPGLGTDETAAAAVEAVLAQDVPVLVDADALTVCARHPEWLRRRSAPTLLTPHDREFERFGEPVTADRVGSARRLAADLGVTVLLKGDATVVVGPDGPARVNGTGSPALATAGSGDVLSGGCGALLAQGLEPLDAGSVGAHLHGRAGALAARGASVPASALVGAWADAVRSAGGPPDRRLPHWHAMRTSP
jgi:hydroxyethylthiazole kinase-like uncharacterized protein yjeF